MYGIYLWRDKMGGETNVLSPIRCLANEDFACFYQISKATVLWKWAFLPTRFNIV